ncbi:MAG: hypothetical protein R3E32_16900 [Chitinophagales bacterium]
MRFLYSLKNNTLSILTVFVLLASMSACTKDAENPIAPTVPPTATMVMEIDDAFLSKSASQEHFNAAAIQIGIWNVILAANLVVPVAAFSAITNELPTFEDGTWIWDKDFNVGLIGHNARLEATIAGNNVNWKMYVSKDNAYADFLWFTGTSVIGNKSGQWILNFSPNNPTTLLQIDWEVNNAGITQIRYTNIIPNHNDLGGFIEYGVIENNAPYDAFYTIYHTDGDFQVDIEWNRTTIEGRIQNPNQFGDNAWHCWNSSLQSIDCE